MVKLYIWDRRAEIISLYWRSDGIVSKDLGMSDLAPLASVGQHARLI